MNGDRIDLAHVAPFRIGVLTVSPPIRTLSRDDGASEVLEPRVMQVLVALGEAPGAILSRDDLIRRCWEGRVVGEDAINRVVSRLRRAGEGIGGGAFTIETITKVGYRLCLADTAPQVAAATAPTAAGDAPVPARWSRRALLIGGGATATLAAGGGWLWFRHGRGNLVAERLAEQAGMSLGQGTVEGSTQSIGLLRRATEIAPGDANIWGLLAMAYAGAAAARGPAFEADMRARAREAIQRTVALDPDNAYARVAQVILRGMRGHLIETERELRTAIAAHPGNGPLQGMLAALFSDVGRWREAVGISDKFWPQRVPSPSGMGARISMLWAAGRLDEADRVAKDAQDLFPTHFAVWFARLYLLLYTGRAAQALGMAEDLSSRPTNIAAPNIDIVSAVARAMIDPTPQAVEHAIAVNLDAAHRGAGFAENSMQFAAALGRVDDAFAIAEAYYFERGFTVPSIRFGAEQGIYTPPAARRTRVLFLPSTTAMRSDRRFDRLCDEIGLTRYWRESGTRPDYRAS